MALTKYNFNSFDVTPVASRGLAFDADADGFTTATPGAMTLITTNTISSGVSSSSFTSSIDSTYDTYMFKFINIHPATDGQNFTVNSMLLKQQHYFKHSIVKVMLLIFLIKLVMIYNKELVIKLLVNM